MPPFLEVLVVDPDPAAPLLAVEPVDVATTQKSAPGFLLRCNLQDVPVVDAEEPATSQMSASFSLPALGFLTYSLKLSWKLLHCR